MTEESADAGIESAATDPRRRTFGPVVLAGLAGAALATVAGSKAWVEPQTDAPQGRIAVSQGFGTDADLGEMPLALALGLVVLASWGVVLVTRGRVRRVVTGLTLLASLALAVTVVVGVLDVRKTVPETLERAGVTGEIGTSITAWFWLAALGALLALLAAAFAIRLAPGWPEMGRRYDSPAGATATTVPLAEQSNLELWQAIGQGDDPTADESDRNE